MRSSYRAAFATTGTSRVPGTSPVPRFARPRRPRRHAPSWTRRWRNTRRRATKYDETGVRNQLGLLHIARGEFDEAASQLAEAPRLYDTHGGDIARMEVLNSLGELAFALARARVLAAVASRPTCRECRPRPAWQRLRTISSKRMPSP
jgi:hypothetical protein